MNQWCAHRSVREQLARGPTESDQWYNYFVECDFCGSKGGVLVTAFFGVVCHVPTSRTPGCVSKKEVPSKELRSKKRHTKLVA